MAARMIATALSGLLGFVTYPMRYWPRWARRAFYWTFPFSAVVWLALFVLMLAVVVTGMFLAVVITMWGSVGGGAGRGLAHGTAISR